MKNPKSTSLSFPFRFAEVSKFQTLYTAGQQLYVRCIAEALNLLICLLYIRSGGFSMPALLALRPICVWKEREIHYCRVNTWQVVVQVDGDSHAQEKYFVSLEGLLICHEAFLSKGLYCCFHWLFI